MREVVFDTETTGLDAANGDRIVELGCVELVNHLPTGREFQTYLNPGRAMSEEAERITGISNEQLQDAPQFGDATVVEALLAFFGNDPIVAHNAEFDRGFLNAELVRLGRDPFPQDRFIDTVPLARAHRPGAPASLNAVCQRFNIPLEGRDLHGALKDARLLAAAYLELRGGRMRMLEFGPADRERRRAERQPPTLRPEKLASRLTDVEREAHDAFIESLGPDAVWKRLLPRAAG